MGAGTFDDAGVAALDGTDLALVQSVDFFPPVGDDPWGFGRIAAANAVSDLYAMGARPFSAMNLVIFDSDAIPLEVLGTILEGGADACREAGLLMLGGHSVKDKGVMFGMAVTGTVKPGQQVTNAGARPGDVLYLTKALGCGCITTAARKGKAPEPVLKAALEQMGALNRGAAEAMAAVGVHAATDVTGYGLLGHAAELAAGSGVDVVLHAGALPLLDGARELMARGFVSGGAARTLGHLAERLDVDAGVDRPDVQLAADAETSGGLLIAVPAGRAPDLERELAARDLPVVAVGEVLPGSGRLRLTR